MSTPEHGLLEIGVSAALRNCADYLRDEHGLTEAAKQIEAVDSAVDALAAEFRAYHDREWLTEHEGIPAHAAGALPDVCEGCAAMARVAGAV